MRDLPASKAVERFRREQPWPDRQLWCFGHAGAGAAEFRTWPVLLGPDVLVCAVRLPGRERRLTDPLSPAIGEVAEQISAEIGGLVSPRSVFYGQCLGAFLAFEVAVRLENRGQTPPGHLFLASQVAPHCTADETTARDISDDYAMFRETLADLGGLPPGVLENDELWALLEPTLRADFLLLEDYAKGSFTRLPVTAGITAVIGADDNTPRAQLEAWAAYSTISFDLVVIENGGHFLTRTSEREVTTLMRHFMGGEAGQA
ncbi:MAG: thioesterase II family protein [Streptosporangiaceae bacterium]